MWEPPAETWLNTVVAGMRAAVCAVWVPPGPNCPCALSPQAAGPMRQMELGAVCEAGPAAAYGTTSATTTTTRATDRRSNRARSRDGVPSEARDLNMDSP
ncbi:hypothetical protein GCM10009733_025940 [Nonomuraea maheshkhaliensis]|uniref:Uncharacterized protein n=1 Tax=Nonomuraea maheshkhaliensis TaxID=419590 RepID=A0ABP4QYG5_9ACTN